MAWEAMVLAVGGGKSLFPLSGAIPKPTTAIAGTSISRRTFDLLACHYTTKASGDLR